MTELSIPTENTYAADFKAVLCRSTLICKLANHAAAQSVNTVTKFAVEALAETSRKGNADAVQLDLPDIG